MRVLIEPDVFKAGGIDPLPLVELLALGHGRRHAMVALPPFHSRHAAPANVWLDSLGTSMKQRLEFVLNEGVSQNATLPSGTTNLRIVNGATVWRAAQFSVGDGTRLLRTPLKLLIENRRNDFAFLRRLIPAPLFATLERAIRNGWLEVEQGGGLGEIKNLLEELATAPPRENPSAQFHRARLWVMIDGDSNQDDRAQPSPQSNEVVSILEQSTAQQPWPIAWVRLGRRSIESYLPIGVLWQWQSTTSGKTLLATRAKFIRALDELARSSPVAHWQINMKDGLLGDVPRGLRDEIRRSNRNLTDLELDPLFRGLGDQQRAALLVGLGDDVASSYAAEIHDWDALMGYEYGRGPQSQPTRHAIAASILTRL